MSRKHEIKMMAAVHPDTIPGLSEDCRRVLRRDYQRIQVAEQMRVTRERVRNGRDAETRAQHEVALSALRTRRDRAVARAIAEYRRTAALWGVEVHS